MALPCATWHEIFKKIITHFTTTLQLFQTSFYILIKQVNTKCTCAIFCLIWSVKWGKPSPVSLYIDIILPIKNNNEVHEKTECKSW